jgi:glycine betaine/proline transport system permease protein
VSATLVEAPAPSGDTPPVVTKPRRRVPKWGWLLIIMVSWIALWYVFYGKGIIESGGYQGILEWFQRTEDSIGASRLTNPLFVYVLTPIRETLQGAYDALKNIFLNLGWTGVIGVAAAISLVLAGWRYALLTFLGFMCFGLLGLWDESMQTLNVVLISVVISLVIGIPVGVWMGVSRRATAFITPILDVMQILPSIAYLPLITLFFFIGPPAGIIATIIYAIPPAIRLTSAGIRGVNASTIEASEAIGATPRQRLRGVQIPLARKSMVLGINQTTLAALSMATIAALIATPGLGVVVLQALSSLNVGRALNASLAIVAMAIVFDRVTTATSERNSVRELTTQKTEPTFIVRWANWIIAAALVVLGIVLPLIIPGWSKFPTQWDVSNWIINTTNDVVNFLIDNAYYVTTWLKNVCTTWLIDPLQSLLSNSPAVVTIAAITLISLVIARVVPALYALFCLIGILLLGVWQAAMLTLTQVLIGGLITMVIGILVGVWMGRNRNVDRGLRPFLDALQVIPGFVYLVPALGLFGPGRFTALIAGVAYAAPVVIKITAEGIRGVPTNTVEAAQAAGSNGRQMIMKVQLPMSRHMQLVALNQGLIYVLAVVVLGGLVGGGGLGYNVIQGFSQTSDQGLGLAAGFGIVLLGIMLDRVSQAAGRQAR